VVSIKGSSQVPGFVFRTVADPSGIDPWRRMSLWLDLSGCAQDGLDHKAGVAPIEARKSVVEADGDSAGDAGGQEQHASFPAAGWQLAGSWPALRAVMAAPQSVLAIMVVPSLMLVPVVMN